MALCVSQVRGFECHYLSVICIYSTGGEFVYLVLCCGTCFIKTVWECMIIQCQILTISKKVGESDERYVVSFIISQLHLLMPGSLFVEKCDD